MTKYTIKTVEGQGNVPQDYAEMWLYDMMHTEGVEVTEKKVSDTRTEYYVADKWVSRLLIKEEI